MSIPYSFTCNCCGKTYEGLPLCFGSDYPNYYFSVPEEERENRIELAESMCVIDEHYFHRGRIVIPIIDYTEDLVFNVWTTISKENFERRNDLWNNPKRIEQEPYFGWLETAIPIYGNTINVKTIAIENEVGFIPNIKIIEENHPLYHEQQNGISFEIASQKVQEILKGFHEGNQSEVKDEDEVTHGNFFGENIRRVINAFKKKS